MFDIDFITSLAVALLFIIASGVAVWRQRIIRDPLIWGMVVSLGLQALAYAIFTYNAYHGLGNAPYRYMLRAFNAALAISVIAVKIRWTLAEREVQALVKRIVEEGRHE